MQKEFPQPPHSRRNSKLMFGFTAWSGELSPPWIRVSNTVVGLQGAGVHLAVDGPAFGRRESALHFFDEVRVLLGDVDAFFGVRVEVEQARLGVATHSAPATRPVQHGRRHRHGSRGDGVGGGAHAEGAGGLHPLARVRAVGGVGVPAGPAPGEVGAGRVQATVRAFVSVILPVEAMAIAVDGPRAQGRALSQVCRTIPEKGLFGPAVVQRRAGEPGNLRCARCRRRGWFVATARPRCAVVVNMRPILSRPKSTLRILVQFVACSILIAGAS